MLPDDGLVLREHVVALQRLLLLRELGLPDDAVGRPGRAADGSRGRARPARPPGRGRPRHPRRRGRPGRAARRVRDPRPWSTRAPTSSPAPGRAPGPRGSPWTATPRGSSPTGTGRSSGRISPRRWPRCSTGTATAPRPTPGTSSRSAAEVERPPEGDVVGQLRERPPAQVVGLVADPLAPRRPGRAPGSGRRGGGSGRRASRSPGARRRAAGARRSPARRSRTPRWPRAAPPSRSVASPGSQCPPSCIQRPTRGCRVSSVVLARRVEHERRRGEVAGHAGARAARRGGRRGRPAGRGAATSWADRRRVPRGQLGGGGGRGSIHSRSPSAGSRGGRGASGSRGMPDRDRAERLPVGRQVEHAAHDVRGEDRRPDPARRQPLGGQRDQQRLHGGAAGHGEHRPLAGARGRRRGRCACRRRCGRPAPAPGRGAAGRRGACRRSTSSAGRPSASRCSRQRARHARRAARRAAAGRAPSRTGTACCGAARARSAPTPTARRSAAGVDRRRR